MKMTESTTTQPTKKPAKSKKLMEYKTVRLERDAWVKLRKACMLYDFDVGTLINWIIDDMNQDSLDNDARDCDHELRLMIRDDKTLTDFDVDKEIESELESRSKKEAKESEDKEKE